MSVYVLTDNGIVTKYPYSLTDMRLDNPSVSFTPDISDATAAEFNVFRVEETPAPTYDVESERLVWDTPIFENGVWKQQWRIEPLSTEELEAQVSQWRQSASCTPFQGKAALFQAGLLDDVEALIADAATDTLTKLAWANAVEWKRMSPMILSLATALELSPTQVDDLFKAAANINV